MDYPKTDSPSRVIAPPTDELYALEHNQHSEDAGMFPFHVSPLKEAVERNLADYHGNHRQQNKWQIIFLGNWEDCHKTMNRFLENRPLRVTHD